ncbi:MAG: hypothetical protein J6N78_04155 [Clostridia bacterium]|nr:hypothetical protein [Clostridia bacterium]
MDKYVLVPYELKGKEGKIVVKEGTPIEDIQEYCVIDRLEKINKEKLAKQVILRRTSDEM